MKDLLVKKGMHGAGLITVDTFVLVDRYNNCLEQLGIERTCLTSFRVDGIGWSPEIATEKGNVYYLSHGCANQYGVLISPDQRRKPIYSPFNSFDRRMMEALFSAFEKEIADITTTHGIALAIDQGLSDLASPRDLLLIDHVIVRASIGNLMETARSQRQLAERFMNEPLAWFDDGLRKSIIENVNQNGDLRRRKLEIPEMQFNDLRSFYTEAFGGVFVIRTEEGKDDLLIVEDNSFLEGQGKKTPRNIFWLHDPKLVDSLFDGIVDIDFSWLAQHPEEIDRRLECVAADVICSDNQAIDYVSLTAAQRKRLLMSAKKMPASYSEVERLRKMLERRTYPERSDLSTEAQLLLLHPNAELPEWYRKVVWQLISRINPHNPLWFYITDKNRFFTEFENWPASKQAWVINHIAGRYRPRMNRG